jgi:ParB-like chromosome segregation protein Spo0J
MSTKQSNAAKQKPNVAKQESNTVKQESTNSNNSKKTRNPNPRRIKGVTHLDQNTIFPHLIKYEPGFNKRDDYGDIQSLALDIKDNGVKKTLLVREENHEIFVIDGHRRLMACQWLKDNGLLSPTLKVKFECAPPGQTIAQRNLEVIRSNNALPMTQIELARQIDAAMKDDPSLDIAAIAQTANRSVSYIKECLILANISPTLKEMKKSNTLAKKGTMQVVEISDSTIERDEIAKNAVKYAQESGRKRANDADLVKAMTERGIPELKIKKVMSPKPKKGEVKEASRKQQLETLYSDCYADNQNKIPYKVLGHIIDFLNKENDADTTDKLKVKMGLI